MTQIVGLLYQPKLPRAVELAGELSRILQRAGARVWACSAWDEAGVREQIDSTDFAVTLGGDGTLLRAARLFAPIGIPIASVNFGRVGFMTELDPAEAVARMPELLAGEAWIEERLMLQARLRRANGDDEAAIAEALGQPTAHHVLNDVVVARGAVSRMIRVRTSVNGAVMTTYAVDAVILATPSGSTAYSFAAGGPILHPEMQNLVITPVCAHLTLARPVVLDAGVRVDLEVFTDLEAGLNIDGQVEIPLHSGDVVTVEQSPFRARFLRLQPRTYFYSTLTRRLRLD